MKNILVLITAILACSISVLAQATEYPKAEVFGGFSTLSIGNGDREQWYGWQAAATGNIHRAIGFVADFGSQYTDLEGLTAKSYEYLFGPRFTARSKKVNGFVHLLFGATNVRGSNFSETGFTMGVGGGVDVNVGNHFAIRVIQFDWLPNRFSGEWSKTEGRLGFGVVFKFAMPS